jgi:hypothetical protein
MENKKEFTVLENNELLDEEKIDNFNDKKKIIGPIIDDLILKLKENKLYIVSVVNNENRIIHTLYDYNNGISQQLEKLDDFIVDFINVNDYLRFIDSNFINSSILINKENGNK